MKRNEIISEFKKGVKAVKYNKKPKDPTAEYGKAKEKLTPQKPLEETNEGRWDRRDAYQRDYDSSVSGFGKDSYAYRMDGGANDEGWDEEPRQRRHTPAADVPHDVYIDGRKWKTFDSASHARNVARKLEAKGKNVSIRASSTEEAMGAELGKITKVDPATKKATLTKPDGSSMEVDSTALKPTADGKMSMDTPDTDELKTGTSVVSTEDTTEEDMMVPSNDSSSPINGDEKNIDLRRIRELAGQSPEDKTDNTAGKMTIPMDKFMQYADDAKKESGINIDVEKIKPMLVMTPSGEVDVGPTFNNMMKMWKSFGIEQLLKDMRQLMAWAEQNRPGPTKTAAAGNAPYNPLNKPETKLGTGTFDNGDDLTRIQELAGMTDEDTVGPRFAGVQQTQHDDGSKTVDYQQGPLQSTNKVDAQGRPITSRTKYDLGIAQVDSEKDHVKGITSNAITTPGMDPNELLPTADIAAARGADPKKFAAFQKQNPSAVKSEALDAMLRIAGLR